MATTPTKKELRDLFKLLDADELQCNANSIVMTQDTFDMLLGPISKAAKYILLMIKEKRDNMLDDSTDHTKIGEILMKISEHPDDELSEQQATMLCLGIAGQLDDAEPDIVAATYTLLSRFLPKASKETRDALIPAMVVHDL